MTTRLDTRWRLLTRAVTKHGNSDENGEGPHSALELDVEIDLTVGRPGQILDVGLVIL